MRTFCKPDITVIEIEIFYHYYYYYYKYYYFVIIITITDNIITITNIVINKIPPYFNKTIYFK